MLVASQGVDLYRSSLSHLLAEVAQIDALLQVQVGRARALYSHDEQFRGLVLSEGEINELMDRPAALPRWACEEASPTLSEMRARQEKNRAQIDSRKLASLRHGVRLRLEELSRLYELQALDVDILLVCLAPEIDPRYERLYAYLHDDITKKRPSVDLVLNLLCISLEEKIAARCSAGCV